MARSVRDSDNPSKAQIPGVLIGTLSLLLAFAFVYQHAAGDDAPAAAEAPGDKAKPAETAAASIESKPVANPAVVAEFRQHVEPILTTYCYECHGLGEKKGGFQLDELSDETITGDLPRWSKVLKNVRAHVMPPVGSEKPSAEELKTLAHWIKYKAFGIDSADIDPGPTSIHRLNRVEYRNTVLDLLGVEFNAADELPPDASGLGFDNIAELLSVSPLMLEKYLNAADAVLDGALPSETARDVVIDGSVIRGNQNTTGRRLAFSGGPQITYTFRNDVPGNYHVVLELEVANDERTPDPAADAAKSPAKPDDAKPPVKPDDAKPVDKPVAEKPAASKPEGEQPKAENQPPKPDAEKSTPDVEKQKSSDMSPPEAKPEEPKSAAAATETKANPSKSDEAKADSQAADAPKTDPAKAAAPKADGAKADAPKAADAPKENTPKADEPKPEPQPQVGHLKVELQSGVSEKVTLLSQDFAKDSKTYQFTFDLPFTTEPHKIDFEIPAPPRQPGAFRGTGNRGFGNRGAPQGPYLAVRRVVFQPQKSDLAKQYFPLDSAPVDPQQLQEYVRKGITEFGLHAFRRPVDTKIVDSLVAEVVAAFHETSHFNESLKPALAKLLCSPRFLFRIDRTVATAAAGQRWALVDEYSLANRLSYFLWSTMPDDELLSLAGQNKLRENLQPQIERMLASNKSRNFVDNFSGQWLQTRNVLAWSIVEKAVLDREGARSFRPVLTPAVRKAMVDETTLCFGRVVNENRSVLDFIDSDYTYLNEDLAKHYQIPGVTGPEMRLVSLNKENHRGGVLTQGSMLLVTSNPNRTSPVKRGVFVLDKFLGLRPHDPPPNIPGLEDAGAAIKDHDPTFREMLELHRADALCASCHKLMDPIGLALENFNAFGAYREKEFNQPIDASGTLITGENFQGIDELKQILLTHHRENFYRCLTEKLLTYGLGREIGYYDTESIDRIVDQLEADGGKFSALLSGIIDSAPFQQRRLSIPPVAAQAKANKIPPSSP